MHGVHVLSRNAFGRLRGGCIPRTEDGRQIMTELKIGDSVGERATCRVRHVAAIWDEGDRIGDRICIADGSGMIEISPSQIESGEFYLFEYEEISPEEQRQFDHYAQTGMWL